MSRTFETSDLYLAAFLCCRGLTLDALNTDDPDRVVFILTPRPDPADLEAYAEDKAVVNMSKFSRTLRTLKHALWQAKEGTDE